MSSARDAFLQRVRQALGADSRPGSGSSIPARGNVGYQGAGPDPAARFCTELAAAGGQAHPVPDRDAASARVLELVASKSVKRVLLSRGAFLDALGLPDHLRPLGIEVMVVDQLPAADARPPFFAADLGISGVDFLIAETGSIVLFARPDEPRSVSLLPPVHIAVADKNQILPDLFDLFDSRIMTEHDSLPSCLSLITGPSKTGDIELRLVTGVHGPGELHVILIGA